MIAKPLFVGSDVAKSRLDVALRPGGEQWAATNDADGLATLVARLHDLEPALVVPEARGTRHCERGTRPHRGGRSDLA